MAFGERGGVIEACPGQVTGSPSANVFIDPTGTITPIHNLSVQCSQPMHDNAALVLYACIRFGLIQRPVLACIGNCTVLSTQEQIFCPAYRYIGASFPQSSVPHAALCDAATAVGESMLPVSPRSLPCFESISFRLFVCCLQFDNLLFACAGLASSAMLELILLPTARRDFSASGLWISTSAAHQPLQSMAAPSGFVAAMSLVHRLLFLQWHWLRWAVAFITGIANTALPNSGNG